MFDDKKDSKKKDIDAFRKNLREDWKKYINKKVKKKSKAKSRS